MRYGTAAIVATLALICIAPSFVAHHDNPTLARRDTSDDMVHITDPYAYARRQTIEAANTAAALADMQMVRVCIISRIPIDLRAGPMPRDKLRAQVMTECRGAFHLLPERLREPVFHSIFDLEIGNLTENGA